LAEVRFWGTHSGPESSRACFQSFRHCLQHTGDDNVPPIKWGFATGIVIVDHWKFESWFAMADAFSGLAKRLQTKPNRRANFAASILSISDDHTHLRAKLCTGSVLEVPVSLLKNIVHLGSADSESDHLEIVSADIDVSSDGGMLTMQLAHEIARLASLLGNSNN
jgi:hypothetical protein